MNDQQKFTFEEWKAHQKVARILSENPETEQSEDAAEIDSEIAAWAAGSSKASKETDQAITDWAKQKH